MTFQHDWTLYFWKIALLFCNKNVVIIDQYINIQDTFSIETSRNGIKVAKAGHKSEGRMGRMADRHVGMMADRHDGR